MTGTHDGAGILTPPEAPEVAAVASHHTHGRRRPLSLGARVVLDEEPVAVAPRAEAEVEDVRAVVA
ncbi:hypothetical protein, partial [Cellulosimicrobium funkei]